MGIWEWTLAAYGRPGVPQATLTLQDAHGQNTSFLLWAVFAGSSDAALLARGAAAAQAWDQLALSPLRDVRRRLKPPHPPVADAAREALREDVKACELQAERILMETLAALSPERGGAGPREALQAASAAWGTPAPAQALADLADALR